MVGSDRSILWSQATAVSRRYYGVGYKYENSQRGGVVPPFGNPAQRMGFERDPAGHAQNPHFHPRRCVAIVAALVIFMILSLDIAANFARSRVIDHGRLSKPHP